MDVIRGCRKATLVLHLLLLHLFVDSKHIFKADRVQALSGFASSLDEAQAQQTAEQLLVSIQEGPCPCRSREKL